MKSLTILTQILSKCQNNRMKRDFKSSYQHGGPEVVLVEELRDEDVHFEDVGHILILDVA